MYDTGHISIRSYSGKNMNSTLPNANEMRQFHSSKLITANNTNIGRNKPFERLPNTMPYEYTSPPVVSESTPLKFGSYSYI